MRIFPVAQTPHGLDKPLMIKARQLETQFLADMLAYGGLESSSTTFGGGIGEEHFSSFLREEQARLMVDRGGIGLAEIFYRALEQRDGK